MKPGVSTASSGSIAAWIGSPPQLGDRRVEHPDVLVEPDRGDRAGLLRAEQLAAAADLEVLRRDLEARAELGEPLQRLEPPARLVGDVLGLGHEQVAVRALLAAADPAAQLVELGEAERVGARDEHRVRARDVEPALDDRRRDQDVELALDEPDHHLLELRRPTGCRGRRRSAPPAPAPGGRPPTRRSCGRHRAAGAGATAGPRRPGSAAGDPEPGVPPGRSSG